MFNPLQALTLKQYLLSSLWVLWVSPLRGNQSNPIVPTMLYADLLSTASMLTAAAVGAFGWGIGGRIVRWFSRSQGDNTQSEGGKTAEPEVQIQEERFKAIVQNSSNGIQLLDQQFGLLYENSAAADLLGSSRTPLFLESMLPRVHPVDRDLVQTWLPAVLSSSGVSHTIAYRLQQLNGSWIWVESTATNWLEHPAVEAIVIISHNITDRKQTEEALRQSVERYRSLVEASADLLVCRWLPDTTLTFVNQTYCQTFGYTEAELLGHPFLRLLPSLQAQQKFQLFVEELMSSRITQIYEHMVPCADGEMHWFRWIDQPLFDEAGQLVEFQSYGIDITDRKRMEEALLWQAQREALFNDIADVIRKSLELDQILVQTAERVLTVFAADRSVIGLCAEGDAVLHYTTIAATPEFNDVTTSEIPLHDNSHAQAVLMQEAPIALDDIQARDDLKSLPIVQQLSIRAALTVAIRFEGKVRGLLCLHQCQAPRNWTEDEKLLIKQVADQVAIALQQSALYRQVQQLNSDLEQQVQERTAQLQQAFQFEATLKRIADKVRDSLAEEQILQSVVQELTLALGINGCNAALYDLESETSTVKYECTRLPVPFQGRTIQMQNSPQIYEQLRQGQHFQLCGLMTYPERGRASMLACPVLDDQGVLGDLWLIHTADYAFTDQDIRLVQQVANQCAIAIRQARLFQKAQAQVAELERLNRLKDDFLSTVSHELRTPMANIKMATQMLEILLFRQTSGTKGSSIDSPSSQAKITRYFQILKDEGQREIGLINDLLDLSRLEAGTEEITLSTIDLKPWLSQIAEPFVERVLNQQQSLIVEASPHLPAFTTDVSVLERILVELLHNACKYTPAEERISVSVHATATGILLRVSNSGVEIPENELAHVFDKFYRVPNNDPWKHGGTGLGLALVKRRVEQLQGTIAVSSEQKNTTFLITLPCQKKLTIEDPDQPTPEVGKQTEGVEEVTWMQQRSG